MVNTVHRVFTYRVPDTVVKPTSEDAPEYAPEPVADAPKEDTDTQWFRG